MKVCIHRGAQEIGGTCVEIESQGKRLVLDVGLPLDAPSTEVEDLYPIPGFDKPDESLLGVCISHPHQDHYGLAHLLPKETRFLIGKAAESILAAADIFTPCGVTLEDVIHFENRTPVQLGPFTITPFLVDHSAYDSYAILVEADGRRLFYSGDFRLHGRKGKLFDKFVKDPPPSVDVLLMEGTTVGRADAESPSPTETELESRFVGLFDDTPGMPLVWCSGQNIDRIVTIFRACKKTGRQFIIDMYTAHVLRATGNERIPQAEWEGIKVFLPKSQKYQIIHQRRFDVSDSYRAMRIFPEELTNVASQSVMLFRPSMMRDIEKSGCLDNATLICSVWSGYLKRDQIKPLLEWLEKHNIPLHHCHTSGHASAAELSALRAAFSDAPVVPIHLDDPDRYVELFDNVQTHQDGEWWTV